MSNMSNMSNMATAIGERESNPCIRSFTGNYRFLSNFYPVRIVFADEIDDAVYASVEHAYQAAKTLIPAERRDIRECVKPGLAKRIGRSVTLRRDWERIKLKVMYRLLWQKFGGHADLQDMLVATGRAELVEGNDWGDKYWGVDNLTGCGHNHLGKLLMQVREEMRV
jgi:ribA/ribD-fused uncharacterized protein